MKKFSWIVIAVLAGVVAADVITSCKKATSEDLMLSKTDTTATTPAKTTIPDSTAIGMIAYYPFNNSAVDMTGNGHDGTVYNITSTTDRNGKTNSAFHFDGISSYVSVYDSQPLRLNNTDFTINTWVKIDSYSPTYGSIIVGKRGTGNANGWNYGIHGYINNVATAGQVTYQVSGGTDPFAAGIKIINTGSWYMLTTIYSVKKQTITYYINGVIDNVVTNIPIPSSSASSNMYIGRDNPLIGALGYFFQGSLDDMRIYGRALTANDMKNLLASTY